MNVKPTYTELEEELKILKEGIIDIASQKEAEQELEKQNKKLNTILNAFKDKIYLCSSDYDIQYMNPEMIKAIGDNAVGKKCYKAIHNSEKPCSWCYFDKLKRENENISIEIERDGRNYIITSTLLENNSKLTIYHDITKIKKQNKELIIAKGKAEASEQHFKKLSDLTFEGILIHQQGIVIDVNKSMTTLTGYKYEELVGENIVELLVPAKYHSLVTFNMEREYVSPYEIEMQRKDGRLIPVELETFTYKSEKMRVTAVRDLSTKKETEKRVLNAMIEAEEKERERFSRDLHDGLGPLLSTMKMYFQWLPDLNDKNKIDTILASGQEHIEEAISTVEEISNNITPRTLKTFGFKAAIRTFIGRLNNFDKVGIKFYCNFEDRIEQNIEATIYRIITELINNTLKHAKADKIEISALLDDTKNILSIHYSDDGVGFDFQKTVRSNKGLGLVNIQQRIKIFGGNLEYKAEANKGIDVKFICKLNN